MRKIAYFILGSLFLLGCEDKADSLLRPEDPQGGGNTENAGDAIRLVTSKYVVEGDSSFVLTVTLPEGKLEEYPLTLDLKVARNYNGADVDQKTLFDNFPVQLTIPANAPSVSDTIKVKNNDEKNQEFEVKITAVVEGYLVQPSPLVLLLKYKSSETGGSVALTDEVKVYTDPSKAIYEYAGFGFGTEHPNASLAANWKFYTGHEFLAADKTATGAPMGWWNQNTAAVEGDVMKVDNDACSKVIEKEGSAADGYLRMTTMKLSTPVANSSGKQVYYKSAAFYGPRPGQGPHWCRFQEGMRIEIRMRRTAHENFNYAMWFMGVSNNNGGVKWPDCGEIDLLESPRYGEGHATLHSANFNSENSNAPTGSMQIKDQSKWNIYWMEWLSDGIKIGVNDKTYFTRNTDYSDWSTWITNTGAGVNAGDQKGFYMLLTTGLGAQWAGGLPDYDFDPLNLPAMEIDWIRVWQKKDVALIPITPPQAPGPKSAVYWKPKN